MYSKCLNRNSKSWSITQRVRLRNWGWRIASFKRSWMRLIFRWRSLAKKEKKKPRISTKPSKFSHSPGKASPADSTRSTSTSSSKKLRRRVLSGWTRACPGPWRGLKYRNLYRTSTDLSSKPSWAFTCWHKSSLNRARKKIRSAKSKKWSSRLSRKKSGMASWK